MLGNVASEQGLGASQKSTASSVGQSRPSTGDRIPLEKNESTKIAAGVVIRARR